MVFHLILFVNKSRNDLHFETCFLNDTPFSRYSVVPQSRKVTRKRKGHRHRRQNQVQAGRTPVPTPRPRGYLYHLAGAHLGRLPHRKEGCRQRRRHVFVMKEFPLVACSVCCAHISKYNELIPIPNARRKCTRKKKESHVFSFPAIFAT